MCGNGRLSLDSLEFGDWINILCLVDLGFRGQMYTWFWGRESTNKIDKRLDRVLYCAQGRLRWQEAFVMHASCNAARRLFHFEVAWLSHEDFKVLLAASWNSNLYIPEALNQMRVKLRCWTERSLEYSELET
ncbi:hypothetical protein V2J09_005882 [Rumex salicifolius]